MAAMPSKHTQHKLKMVCVCVRVRADGVDSRPKIETNGPVARQKEAIGCKLSWARARNNTHTQQGASSWQQNGGQETWSKFGIDDRHYRDTHTHTVASVRRSWLETFHVFTSLLQ